MTVGASNDQYEQEADRVARQVVVSMPDAVAAKSLQPTTGPEEDKDQKIQAKPLADSITPVIQRQGQEDEKDQSIQPKSAASLADSLDVGEDVESRLSQSKGGGSPLPDPVRAYMEPRFGVDFSHVRVHTGSDAIQMNRNVGAQAFTHGSDIYFGAGSSPANLDLTAHELAHVVQQQDGLDFGQPVLQRRTVREEYATTASEEGPICDVRLVITGAPESDTEDLMEFIDAAERGIRRACGTLPRSSSRAIHVTMPHRRGDNAAPQGNGVLGCLRAGLYCRTYLRPRPLSRPCVYCGAGTDRCRTRACGPTRFRLPACSAYRRLAKGGRVPEWVQ